MTSFPKIRFVKEIKAGMPVILLFQKVSEIPSGIFAASEIKSFFSGKKKNEFLEVRTPGHKIFAICVDQEITDSEREKIRRNAAKAMEKPVDKISGDVFVFDCTPSKILLEPALEGLLLAIYSFRKYKTVKKPLDITVYVNGVQNKLTGMINSAKAVYICRDLINEPPNTLNASKLSKEFTAMGKEAGFGVTVFGKRKIASLGMAGLLTVNKGSEDEPTFTVMEYKHPKAKNKKPVVLVGKGVVIDTGGLNLKSYDSMLYMKSDMSGAAAVASVMYAVALSQLPLYVVALVPATDNRPSGNAAVSGDVIKMINGVTVEVMNTDAEGRLILADALAYAQKYDPLLVIDIATLTGSASAAIGRSAMVAMGNAEFFSFSLLETCGYEVYERIVRFPLWDDYKKMIESKIADIKNVGNRHAGAITAGKFLECFVDYPWIHLDIAGPAFIEEKDGYRNFGGTGVGVRLLYRFLEKLF
jgi:leucyl aminopeptidase